LDGVAFFEFFDWARKVDDIPHAYRMRDRYVNSKYLAIQSISRAREKIIYSHIVVFED
jgi:hypothetical protein